MGNKIKIESGEIGFVFIGLSWLRICFRGGLL
jgi:hypothetical protein